MTGIPGALDVLVGQIQAALPATRVARDPARILPPCVHVGLPSTVGATLGGGLRLDVPVYAVAANPGDQAAMDPLLEVLPALIRAAGGSEPASAVSLQVTEDLSYPAYRTTARITSKETP